MMAMFSFSLGKGGTGVILTAFTYQMVIGTLHSVLGLLRLVSVKRLQAYYELLAK